MMGLAVDIVGNGAANGDEFRPRADHRQPPLRSENRNDLFQANAGLAFQDTLLLVKGKKSVEFCAFGYKALFIQGLVAIAAAQSPCDQSAFLQGIFKIRFAAGGQFVGCRYRVVTPSGQCFFFS